MVWFGRRSDRKQERRWHAAAGLALAAGGIALSTALDDPTLKMIALSGGAAGVFGVLPGFWNLPKAFLSGSAAAARIAIINSLRNLSGLPRADAMAYPPHLPGELAR